MRAGLLRWVVGGLRIPLVAIVGGGGTRYAAESWQLFHREGGGRIYLDMGDEPASAGPLALRFALLGDFKGRNLA